jgi:hypothetical protein
MRILIVIGAALFAAGCQSAKILRDLPGYL